METSRLEIKEQEAKIDLTPMLDVVFIMLIFFIVTASFIREAGISIETPPEGAAQTSDENPNVIVQLMADNQIFIDGRSIDHRALRAYFERHRAENPEAALIIQAEKNAKTFAVARISDAARLAGIFQIVLQSEK